MVTAGIGSFILLEKININSFLKANIKVQWPINLRSLCMGLYDEVRKIMGKRYKRIEQDQDEHQEFWVGLLDAQRKHPDKSIPYLIRAGYWSLMTYRRSERSKDLADYCEKCNIVSNSQMRYCPKCGSEMHFIRRKVEYNDVFRSRYNIGLLERLVIEQFIETQCGSAKYIAKRWMIDRADLLYRNYQEQLAREIGISQQAISKHCRKIKNRFIIFYNGCT